MGILRTALIGAAVYSAVKYLTKKDALGRTKMDEIRDKAPQWIEKARNMVTELKEGPVPKP